MKKLIALFALLLSLALVLPCVSGIAESGPAAGQPMSYIDQDTFLTWLRTYDPEANIAWEPWRYMINYFNGQYVSNTIADLSDDQSTVLSGRIAVLDDIPKEAQSIINNICKVMKDKLSAKSLKELKTGEWGNPKEVLSDKEKLSFSYDTRHVEVKFLVEESEFLSVDAFYKAAAIKKVYDTTITRYGEISKMKPFASEYWGDLTEEEKIEYSEKSKTAYTAEIYLDGAGRVTTIAVKCPKETNNAESMAAFLQDAASQLLSGDTLESVKSIIGEKLPSVLDEEIHESVYEYFDTLSFYLMDYADHVRMSVQLQDSVPEDAVGFIGGQIFGLK